MATVAVRLPIMGRKARGLWPLVAVAAIEAGTIWLAYAVWRSPHRTDLATYGAFVAALVPITAGCFAWAWRARGRQDGDTAGVARLDQLADLLADGVTDQWTRAAGDRGLLEPQPIPVRWQRPSEPFAGPVWAAVGSRRFAPLPGLCAVTEQQLHAGHIVGVDAPVGGHRRGQLGGPGGELGDLAVEDSDLVQQQLGELELHAVYGGLGSGRLVIVGAPGSGKSGAAVLLVLAALKHREQVPEKDRPRVPVPVMFTMHGWDPNTQRVQDWLAARLRRPTRCSRASAARRTPLSW